MRADKKAIPEAKIPMPSIVVTDIFDICKLDENEGHATGAGTKEPQDVITTASVVSGGIHKHLTFRVKADKYELNPGHYYEANIKDGVCWKTEPSKYVVIFIFYY